GRSIENAKPEVSGLTKNDKLPYAFQANFSEGAYFVGANMYGSTISGNFLLRVSATGFEAYERRFNFPVCEIQRYELRLRPKGSTAKAQFVRLFTVHGKVYDEEKKPFGKARIEAVSADGRTYQATSNAYGYFEIYVPVGPTDIRVSGDKFPDVVFDNYKVEKNYSVLNVPVCLKCSRKQTQN
ncbi:MAG TPA: carboxypeptidase-like regulatory domain-containing protein, partial [Pyrinomonadaceae bacterium]|nr:carboxypeptidase-like regulatory domain-containing protein [Pyrinomonadaceae bacterium]